MFLFGDHIRNRKEKRIDFAWRCGGKEDPGNDIKESSRQNASIWWVNVIWTEVPKKNKFVEAEGTLTIEIAFYFQVFWLFKITTKKLLGRVWWRTRQSVITRAPHLWDTSETLSRKSQLNHRHPLISVDLIMALTLTVWLNSGSNPIHSF